MSTAMMKITPDMMANPEREVGSGTYEDPLIMWLYPHPTEENFPGRVEAVEMVCRHACWYINKTVCYIRGPDKTGTRAPTQGKPRGTRHKVPDDAHVTVFMSNVRGELTHEGHIYVAYDGPNPDLPTRMMYPQEREHPIGGETPKLHEAGSSIPLTFLTTLWNFYHSPQFVYLSGLAQR